MTKYCSQAITKNIYKSNSEKSEISYLEIYSLMTFVYIPGPVKLRIASFGFWNNLSL